MSLITDAMLDGLQKTINYNLDGTIDTEVVTHVGVTYTRTWTYPDAVTKEYSVWVRS